MADNSTNIFSFKCAGEDGVNSIKNLKSEIQDLKKELESLEIGSKEFEETSERLWEKQSELTDVIKDSKRPIEEAKGSYYALNKELVELRKTYRSLSEEERNGNFGTETLSRIQALDAQLKDLDAGMGQYFRNVGDYRNAFTESFDKMLGPLSKVGGSFGTLARDVKGMIPLIKNLNTTAITGLQGIKAAIASTGIGLLVIAVGELAAHWEDVYKWITGTDKATESLAETTKQVTDSVDEQTKNIGYQVQLMQAEGKTQVQILKYQVEENKNALLKLQAYKEIVDKKIEEIEAHGILTKLAHGEYILLDALRKASNETADKIAQMSDKLEGLQVSLKAAEIREGIDKLKNYAANSAAAKKAMDALKESAKKFIEQFKNAELTDIQKIDKQYEENTRILEEYYKGAVISEEEYQEAKKLIEEKYRKDKKAIEDAEAEKQKQEAIKTAEDTAKAAIDAINRETKNAKLFGDLDRQLKDLENQIKAQKEKPTFKGFWKTLFDPEGAKKAGEERAKQIEEDFQREKTASEDKIKVWENLRTKYAEDSEEYKNITKQIEEEKTRIEQLESQKRIDIKRNEIQTQKEISEEYIQIMQTVAAGLSSIGNIINSVASLRQQDLQRQVQEGKKSEEQAKKDFKRVKSMQYTATIMNSAAGQLGAFAQAMATIPPPYGAIVGGINATAVLAQGIIQLATIKRQQFGSTSGGLNSSTPNLSNVVNTYTPQMTASVQTTSELENLSNAMGNINPVVTVTDIEDGLQTNKVRVEESSL